MDAVSSRKSQSAMEYLMTYGWAILIIAVVLGALYSLGVFNAVNFMPKVPGGGCHVFRPNGPGTSWNVNLVGSCNNALPQYVAQFNGQSSRIVTTKSLSQMSQMTIVGWINIPSSSNWGTLTVAQNNGGNKGILWEGTTSTSFTIIWDQGGSIPVDVAMPVNRWIMMAFVVNAGTGITEYGFASSTPSTSVYTGNTITIDPGIYNIGRWQSTSTYGSIANVQIYNTSLTANQVQYLYNEGIGGVPISPQYLVGWWPLNGDTNDYSGNNNNGVPTNVIFNGTWTGGYNAP